MTVLKFDMHVQDPWEFWDGIWLRSVGCHAKWLCIRVTGLFGHARSRPMTPDDPRLPSWLAGMKRIIGTGCRRVAPAILQFQHLPAPGNALERGRPFDRGNDRLRNWADTMHLSHRLDFMLRMVRAETQLPVLLHVEDFSARWALAANHCPTLWVMDNPFVGRDEASDLWSAPLSRPGILRHSRLEQMSLWSSWRMHLSPHELLTAELPIRGRHGRWPARSRYETLQPLTRYFCSTSSD